MVIQGHVQSEDIFSLLLCAPLAEVEQCNTLLPCFSSHTEITREKDSRGQCSGAEALSVGTERGLKSQCWHLLVGRP